MYRKPIFFAVIFIITIATLSLAAPRRSTLVLVCIGKDISKKIRSRKPFIDYLAKQLRSEGIKKGHVKVVEGIPEVASMLNRGDADIFVDSPFPVLLVDHLAEIKYPLRRWKKGVAEYSSVIFTHKDTGIKTLGDLKGKMISFEERYSTTGYFLPKTILLDQHLKLKHKRNRTSKVASDEIGYLFSEGDETTMVWVLRKRTHAGAIDQPNFVDDARDQISNLHILHRSEPIPRHLFAYRSNLDSKLVKEMTKVLLNMDQSQEGRDILKSYQKTKKFDKVPTQSSNALNRMRRYIKQEFSNQ